jgi:hypothetical protein
MTLARIVFYIAFIWGLVIITPLFFIFDLIGQKDPPPITHPAFFYGFATTALAFQFVFFVIARDPIRFRPIMLPSILEKFGYAAALSVLFSQHRLHPQDFALAAIDSLFGILFLIAFLKTGPSKSKTLSS